MAEKLYGRDKHLIKGSFDLMIKGAKKCKRGNRKKFYYNPDTNTLFCPSLGELNPQTCFSCNYNEQNKWLSKKLLNTAPSNRHYFHNKPQGKKQ